MAKKITRWLLFRKFLVPLGFLVSLVIAGSVGYMIIEAMHFIDALYMTVITVSTVGFREVKPLSDAGKIFTIVIIITSIALVAFYVTMITRLLLDGEWRKEYREYLIGKKLMKMKQHIIVCGYGRNGHEACVVLKLNGLRYTVIEQRAEYVTEASRMEDLVVPGDATKDEVLIEAGIERARAIITALPSDADNLFVVVTARQLNPSINIISRVSNSHSVSKIKNAGANAVVMPDKLGGAQMASMVLKPEVQEFLTMLFTEHTDAFMITELPVTRSSSLGSLDLWKETGCTVIGLKQTNGLYIRNPQPDHLLQEGEHLIVMGNNHTLARAKALLS